MLGFVPVSCSWCVFVLGVLVGVVFPVSVSFHLTFLMSGEELIFLTMFQIHGPYFLFSLYVIFVKVFVVLVSSLRCFGWFWCCWFVLMLFFVVGLFFRFLL